VGKDEELLHELGEVRGVQAAAWPVKLKMKTVACIALACALASSASPALAEGRLDIQPGPIGRAIALEATRLEVPDSTTPVADSAVRRDRPGPSDWSRVVRLERGREITLTSVGSQSGKRYLVNADAAGLTIVDVDHLAVSDSARDVLVDAARHHPEYFGRAQGGGVVLLGKDVRLGPDGAFQRDRKIADLAQIARSIPRSDVVEISVLAKHVGRHTWRGALIGAIVGATVAGAGAASCRPGSECYSVPGLAAAGALIGGVYGTGIGAIVGAVAPRSPNVIYRAG